MRDRIEKLRTLVLLRHRDVERRTRDVAEAAQALTAAEAAMRAAEHACDAARLRLDRALHERVRDPADGQAHLFCQCCETGVGEADAALESSEEDVARAGALAAEARRALMRAQVRYDALSVALRRAQLGHRQARERRAQDDLPAGGALSWA